MKKILLIQETLPQNCVLAELKQSFSLLCASSVEAVKNLSKLSGGLNQFDVIILDPVINPYPLYSYSRLDPITIGGWRLYLEFMKDLDHAKIVILVPSFEDIGLFQWGENIVSNRWKGDYRSSYIPLLDLV